MRLNLAARAGRWSAAHWKTATFGWIAFVVAALAIGAAVGTKHLGNNDGIPGESGRMERILAKDFKQPAGETVLIQSRTLTASDPAFAAAIDAVTRRVSSIPAVMKVRSPLARGNDDQISADGRAAIVRFNVRGDPDKAADKIGPVLAAVAKVKAGHAGLFVGEFGDASAEKGIGDSITRDFERAGLLSVTVTIVILLIAFGALVAAGLPLLLALSGVLATLGLLAVPSHFWPVDQQVSAVVLLIGLAVGVDYSLFYVKREREERAAGRGESAALAAAAATSGGAVLVSGLSGLIARAGMFVPGDKPFGSYAMATMMVVAIAVLGSLTVLPALLSRLGDGVNRLRIPGLPRLQRPGGGRAWGWVLDRVLRRPAVSVVVSAGVLLVLALPALQMKTVVPGAEAFPKNLEPVKVYNRLEAAFPGEPAPAVVVVKAPSLDDPRVQRAIRELRTLALASGQF